MFRKSISLVILCYNDGESLPELVKEAFDVLDKNFSQYQIVITDDGSNKQTLEVLKQLKNQYNNLIITGNNENKGVGANFYTGIKATKFETIAYMDGDGQYTPKDLVCLFEQLTPNNMVSGLRVKRNDSITRKTTSTIYNLLLKILYNLKYKDVNSGIKLFNRDILMSFTIDSKGPFFDAEVILKHQNKNCEILEIPVQHFSRKHGKANGIGMKNIRMIQKELFSAKFESFKSNKTISRIIYSLLKTTVKIFSKDS